MLKRHSLLLIPMMATAAGVQAEAFTPNGSASVTQTFYGEAGDYETEGGHSNVDVLYNFTPDISLELEWDRAWNLYTYTGADNQYDNSYSNPQATLSISQSSLFGSKATGVSSLNIQNHNVFDGTKTSYVLLQQTIGFADYFDQSGPVSVSELSIEPTYIYGWNTDGPSGSVNTASISLLSTIQLPANFSITLNGYLFRDWYSGDFVLSGEGNQEYKSANFFMLMAWLQYSSTLHKFSENDSLDFSFVGGLDPYITSNRRASWSPFLLGDEIYEWNQPTQMNGNYKNTYVLFALPEVTYTYNFNKDLSLNVFAGVKYSNQVWGDDEKDWEWQPQGGLGLSYNF
ncbi:hypothetical protein [Enterovibrio paralichthyis]|uniref:FomA family porin-like outer membrane protein n=1 Tax=Enterovibrio paralichthyis TaxID=2853805 RepID=UPI001C46C1F5|nr:hypothetical protein [Enterovibrio paralichthyis]MBV7299621.1 hypothetical protein [Enterovibrio paralichthyis]